MSPSTNLHKSEAGWKRLQERTNKGANARGSFMEHTVQSTMPKADVVIPKFEGETEKPRRRRRRAPVS